MLVDATKDVPGMGVPKQRTGRLALLERMVAEVRADHQAYREYDAKYGKHNMRGSFLSDATQKIGLQIMIGVRAMRLFRDAGVPVAAKVVSRLIRHLYGSDIHWDADFEPGVAIAHGMAIAISGDVHVSTGCILSHGVSIGVGSDPVTRKWGSPRLEKNVHVGPGAILIGPITVGEGTKIQPLALVTQNVPPGSAVIAPQPEIKARKRAVEGESTQSSGEPLRAAVGDAALPP
jgi:serine acetyltransferase